MISAHKLVKFYNRSVNYQARRSSEILHRVRELLSEESKWTQIAVALTGEGQPCDPLDDTARIWSLQGALRKFGPLNIICITALLANSNGFDRVDAINLAYTHKDLLALIDRAIFFAERWE